MKVFSIILVIALLIYLVWGVVHFSRWLLKKIRKNKNAPSSDEEREEE